MLDEKDGKIIEFLRQNSRLTIHELADLTGQRPSTVHVRLRNLIKNGIIERFTIKANNAAIGEGFIVWLLLSTSDKLSPAFLSNPHIKEAFGITGEYDLLLKLKFSDVHTFNTFLLNLRNQAQITKTLSMVTTANLKEEL